MSYVLCLMSYVLCLMSYVLCHYVSEHLPLLKTNCVYTICNEKKKVVSSNIRTHQHI